METFTTQEGDGGFESGHVGKWLAAVEHAGPGATTMCRSI